MAPEVASVRSAEPLRQKEFLQSYPVVVNYCLKKLISNKAIFKMDSVILFYTQLTSMTPTEYADYLYTESCDFADVYDESALNGNFIKDVNTSICRSLEGHWAYKPHSGLTDIAFTAQSLLVGQKGSVKLQHSWNQNATAKQIDEKSWRNKTANVVDTESTTAPCRSSHSRSKSLPVLVISAPTSSFTTTNTPSSTSTLPSPPRSTYAIRWDHAHSTWAARY